ncbi:helix-turn-helix domain-containing protein [Algibacter lectus]|uniref:helix-turn-helix domain-containing protein n=1 Tax=Algibacter lectus TaxID=221126 RepID=UPI0026F1FC13|nr:helix-turn-helix domain-containing protein [Algibacter lectus]MDO7138278.1 helix-turn-helix domain-containing protein [Algibacter lectus]
MKGIVFQNIEKKEFDNLSSKVEELNVNVKRLIETKIQERISPEKVAEEQNCTVQTVYAQIKDGRLKAERIGRKLLIRRSDLENSLKEVKSLKYKR